MIKKLFLLCLVHFVCSAETLPPLADGQAPQTYDELWADFDPRAEPLDVEVLHEWEEDGVVLQVLRYRVGVFKGQKAMMAGVYAYPKGGKDLPGLVNIHGGGQFADYRSVLTNAKRGYASITIAWAGRIAAPNYSVNAEVVQTFWANDTRNPKYKVTTDWGALDAYHAPSRNRGNGFADTKAAEWTLDTVDSPRNNPWFLVTMGARRALTFLEQQPEVDGARLGVYGHSMGGKLTVATTAADRRVRASVPSCGGVSNRNTGNALYDATIADDISLAQIDCPILFQSPSNDFHGRINDLQTAVTEIGSKDWRVTCAPHHNHQDTADYEVASQLWFDQHLKGSFEFPQTPELLVNLKTKSGVPVASLKVDDSKPILSVDFYYTRQGQIDGLKDDRVNTKNRFWHHAEATQQGENWMAELPLHGIDQSLWVYANVRYALDAPVSYAGYYYGVGTSESFNLSSLMFMVAADELKAAGVRSTLESSLMIEDFEGDWEKEWFSYRPNEWARATHKIYDALWQAPEEAKLNLQVSAAEANKLVVRLDDYAAEVTLEGGSAWEAIELQANDFTNGNREPLVSFEGIKELELSPKETLKGAGGARRVVGANWKGADPVFNDLYWSSSKPAQVVSVKKGAKLPLQQRRPDTYWTYKEINGKELKRSVFLPEGYETSDPTYPTFVAF